MKDPTAGKGIWSDPEYCKRELLRAREAFCSTETTREQYEGMQRALSLMCLHCPEEFKSLAFATLLESNMRYSYFALAVWKQV